MPISRPDEGWHDAISRLYNESDEAKRLEDAKRRAAVAFIRARDRAREEGEK